MSVRTVVPDKNASGSTSSPPAVSRIDWSRWRPYLFIAPVVLYLLVFQIYPMFREIGLSLTDASLVNPAAGKFIGFENYQDILSSDNFLKTLKVTLVYTFFSVVGTLTVALGAALLINRPFLGRGLVRGTITIPWAAPEVAVVLIYIWIFNNQYGVANFFLTKIGILTHYTRWLDNPDLALPVVLFVTVWKIFPFSALVLLAALQSIPDDLYEAAHVDGADRLNAFKNVTLPAIYPTLAVLTLLVTIWSLRRFTIIWLMTQGGPVRTTNTLVIDLYRESFKHLHLGYGAAIGVIGLGISVVATSIYFLASRQLARSYGGKG